MNTTTKTMINDEQLDEINKATAEWTMMAARGECGWICADCCASFPDGMPDECFHGHQRCTDIIKRDKIEASEQKTGMLPLELTAENGAKALLIGEFYEEIHFECGNCGGDGIAIQDEECDECDGTGQITQRVDVQWTTIKAIYKMIVEHYTS